MPYRGDLILFYVDNLLQLNITPVESEEDSTSFSPQTQTPRSPVPTKILENLAGYDRPSTPTQTPTQSLSVPQSPSKAKESMLFH